MYVCVSQGSADVGSPADLVTVDVAKLVEKALGKESGCFGQNSASPEII